MYYPEERFLFTIREAAHACGVGRTTLLRMEECGFLTPYRIDPNTGYRYYDAQNIAQIGQYQLLQELGLSRKEITDIYYQNIDVTKFISDKRAALTRLQHLLTELEMRTTHSDNYRFTYTELSEITCYCASQNNLSIEEAETFTYKVHQDAIKAGYQLLGIEPLFLYINSNHLNGIFDSKHPENEITVCIPVITSDSTDSHLKSFPKSHAFSVIGYGNYFSLKSLPERLYEEISNRKLKPLGPPRIIAHVATYVGTHISPNNFCFELVVPINNP